jgi:hypothetical protein
MSSSYPPPSYEDIDRTEEVLRATLPDDYRGFLMSHNGGRPIVGTFDFHTVTRRSNSTVIDRFFSVHPDDDDSVSANFIFFADADRIPRHVAPIARDMAGNLVCLELAGPRFGSVLFWDHELEPSHAGDANLAFVSPSFTQFLSMLYD